MYILNTFIELFDLMFLLVVQTQTAASSLLRWLQHSGLMVSVLVDKIISYIIKDVITMIPATAVVAGVETL